MSVRPGDGSAREQAASCQRVLGGCANLCLEYATKRYRSNVINWGMVPFTVENIETLGIQPGDQVYVPGIRKALEGDADHVVGTLIQPQGEKTIRLDMKNLSREERDVILAGCLINYYAG
jgi:aconitate hydratase